MYERRHPQGGNEEDKKRRNKNASIELTKGVVVPRAPATELNGQEFSEKISS